MEQRVQICLSYYAERVNVCLLLIFSQPLGPTGRKKIRKGKKKKEEKGTVLLTSLKCVYIFVVCSAATAAWWIPMHKIEPRPIKEIKIWKTCPR